MEWGPATEFQESKVVSRLENFCNVLVKCPHAPRMVLSCAQTIERRGLEPGDLFLIHKLEIQSGPQTRFRNMYANPICIFQDKHLLP